MSVDPRWSGSFAPAGRGGSLAGAVAFAGCVAMLVAHLGSALGPVVPVVSLAGPFVVLLASRQRIDAGARRFAVIAAFPLVALLSTLWSELPGTTLYYAVQLAETTLCAWAIWIHADGRGFVRIVLVAALAICLMSLASGQTGPSVTGPVLVGITGSKNAMASAGQLLALAAAAVLADPRQPGVLRAISLPAVALGVWLVATTHAATIVILTLAAPALALLLLALRAVPRRVRPVVLAAAVLAASPLALVGGRIAARAQDYTLSTFNKDPGLSGRAYLWEVAWYKIAERPVAGHGYRAFWMNGSADTIGLLRSQKIADPRRFSLHQSWLEAWVDTGVIGLAVLALAMMAGLAGSVVRAVYTGGAANVFGAVYLVTLAVRTFGETLFVPFYAYGTIAMVLCAYGLFGTAQAPPPRRALRPVRS